MEELLQQLAEAKIESDNASKKYEILKEKVKTYMVDNRMKSLNSEDNKIECIVNYSTRKTCRNKTGLMKELVKNNLKAFIKTDLIPDIESLSTEQGALEKDIYNKFVKETEVATFKTNINV